MYWWLYLKIFVIIIRDLEYRHALQKEFKCASCRHLGYFQSGITSTEHPDLTFLNHQVPWDFPGTGLLVAHPCPEGLGVEDFIFLHVGRHTKFSTWCGSGLWYLSSPQKVKKDSYFLKFRKSISQKQLPCVISTFCFGLVIPYEIFSYCFDNLF